MEACGTLKGYAHLLALARRYRVVDGLPLDDAVNGAIADCIAEGVLVHYLVEHRAEVEDMLFTIQDEERAMRVHWEAVEREARETGHAEGYAEGHAEGKVESIQALMNTLGCDSDKAMDMLGIAPDERAKYEAMLSTDS